MPAFGMQSKNGIFFRSRVFFGGYRTVGTVPTNIKMMISFGTLSYKFLSGLFTTSYKDNINSRLLSHDFIQFSYLIPVLSYFLKKIKQKLLFLLLLCE